MTYLMMQMLLCLLIAFLLGFLLGWWLGRRALKERLERSEVKWRQKLDGCRNELSACRVERDQCGEERGSGRQALEGCQKDLAKSRKELEASRAEHEKCGEERAVGRQELESCRQDLESCQQELEACRQNPATEAERSEGLGSSPVSAVETAVPLAFADRPADASPDDLTKIEGIGRKISGLLEARAIKTWETLAGTEVPVLQSVLDDAGPRYRMHDPGSWPQQARLAADGSWDALAALQDRLKGGREAAAAALAEVPDDLKKIEGIGPKIEGLLNDRGIMTWKGLAAAQISDLQSVLDDAGPRYRIHDPETWPQQAALAATGSWDELEQLQDRLKGGRKA